MPFRPWVLAEVPYQFVKDNRYAAAVLPMGATEPHNLHLPYGTDTYEVEELAEQACATAYGKGAMVARLPVIPFGTETNLERFPLAMNLNPSTLRWVISDLVDSLDKSGIKKLLILNGHGGNDFKPLLRELYGKTPVQIFLCDWFKGLAADAQREIFDSPGDHAGEMETSMGLAFFPDLVQIDPITGDLAADQGRMRATQIQAVNQGWVSITRPWHLLTTNTGAGNPHLATAEKGKKLMEIMVKRLSEFLIELAELPMTDSFPY
ncbi:MAG: crnA 2 [Planctomycetaceae bacterium]|nr:crnA 2 [Planctomycetaceae bacterium]